MLYFERFYRRQDILNEGGEGSGAAGGAGASGGNGTGASGGAANGAANNAGAGGVDWSKWQEALPDDVKKDPGIAPFKTLPDLAKGYISLQKTLGKDKVSIPDPKHATEADWLNVYRRLGAPDKVDDFKFKLPDGVDEKTIDADFMKSVKEAAVAAGVAPWQFEKIFGAYHKTASSRVEASQAEFKATRAADIDNLKKEWGQAYDKEVKKANTAFMEFLKPEERARLIEDGLAGHPSVVKILANAAKLLSPDKFLGHGDGDNGNMTPAEALSKAQKIQGDPNHPYRVTTHPNHKAAQEEVKNLYKIAYPQA